MHFTRATSYAVRLSVTQVGSATGRQPIDRLVLPSALLLAGLGLGLSTFSVKQLLATARPKF
ncbi:hypothetical protein L798_14023 [Zootermopsis nevadensis]|uniref:Uncharacterized protein n=1 Tax=Zootermopsis nevadensis TaxID=136037 RepID=A0A067QPK0_ZOONE|nr:hypothetical protein L798_14023 [Zootermopsis nevadensis]